MMQGAGADNRKLLSCMAWVAPLHNKMQGDGADNRKLLSCMACGRPPDLDTAHHLRPHDDSRTICGIDIMTTTRAQPHTAHCEHR